MPRIVRLVTGPLGTNTYILVSGSGGCIVIDPGECIPEERLRKAGCQRVEVVAATHMHIDHVAGVECLRRLGAAYAANPGDRPALDYSLRLARIWGIEPPEPPGEPDIPLHDGTRLRVGDAELEAMHTPATRQATQPSYSQTALQCSQGTSSSPEPSAGQTSPAPATPSYSRASAASTRYYLRTRSCYQATAQRQH